MRRPAAVLVVALAATVLSACASSGQASRTAAVNGYGSGAQRMVYAHLRPGTDQQTGSDLSQTMITKPGVVFTNWTAADGVTVGVGDLSQLSFIETFLRAQPAVIDITEGPTPTTPPTQNKQ
jgi:hypothetical protein